MTKMTTECCRDPHYACCRLASLRPAWSSRRSTRSAHHREAAIGEEGEAVVEVRLGQVVHHGHMRAALLRRLAEDGVRARLPCARALRRALLALVAHHDHRRLLVLR